MARLATVTVRMAPELKDRIKGASDRDGVSMNVWIVSAAETKLAGGLRGQDVDRLNQLTRDVARINRLLGIEGGLA